MTEWINIKDKLPDHNQIFLGTSLEGNMIVVRCDLNINGDKILDYVFMLPDLKYQVTGITHWMPLPKPPENE